MKAALAPTSDIHVDPLFASLRQWLGDNSPTSVAVVTDPMTEKWCLSALNPHLPPGTQFLRLGQHGEKIKSLEHAHALWDSFEGMGMDRHGLVIALGGGTISDLTAFASSTYLRGVRFWLIPTTLLSMVDASIGGKTGINFRGLKNRIGTFAKPEGVSIHTDFLDTLDAREMANGWAEHIKHTLWARKAHNVFSTTALPTAVVVGLFFLALFLKAKIQAHTVGRLLAGYCVLMSVVMTGLLIYCHLAAYSNPTQQRRIIRILLMVPIYAVDSYIALWNHDIAPLVGQ